MFTSDLLYVTQLDVMQCFPPRGRLAVRERNFHSLSLCLSGNGEISTDKLTLSSPPGSVLLMPQGVSYTSIIKDSREIIACHFHLSSPLSEEPQIIFPSQGRAIASDFTRLLELFESPTPADRFVCMSRFYQILSKLLNESDFHTMVSEFDRRLLPVIEYVHNHYDSAQAADVEYLASLAGFTSAYLRRLFIKEYGIPTSTYVKNYRLNRAKTLLNSGYYSVTEVAGRVGFDSPSYFAKEFRKYTGYSPQAFSKMEQIE